MMRVRTSRRESGQAMVETAIVMPLFVFIILGLFQLMLMHQARYFAKYAAYKAARAGALHRAKKAAMEDAALAVLLPMAGRANTDGAVYKTPSPTDYLRAWAAMKNNQQYGFPVVSVTTCNPVKGRIKSDTDFDDAAKVAGTGEWVNEGGRTDSSEWKNFDNSKLAVQVTFYYRMFIPFANGVLWWITLGNENPELLRVTRLAKTQNGQPVQGVERGGLNGKRTIKELERLTSQHIYILPIRASYAMRMQSNVLENELPNKNECQVPWKKKE